MDSGQPQVLGTVGGEPYERVCTRLCLYLCECGYAALSHQSQEIPELVWLRRWPLHGFVRGFGFHDLALEFMLVPVLRSFPEQGLYAHGRDFHSLRPQWLRSCT